MPTSTQANVKTLLELAARCEAATGPDLALNDDIARARAKWESKLVWSGLSRPYTASLDAAMTLVPEGFKWKCGFSDHVPHWCELWPDDRSGYLHGYSDHSRPLAICAAALRARANMTEGGDDVRL